MGTLFSWVATNASVIKFIFTMTGIVIAQVISILAFFKIKELHILVNSRLTELLAETKNASFSKGREAGVTAQQNRNDQLAALQVVADDKSSRTVVTPVQTPGNKE